MAECTGYLKALADLDLLDDFGESLNRITEHVIEEQRRWYSEGDRPWNNYWERIDTGNKETVSCRKAIDIPIMVC